MKENEAPEKIYLVRTTRIIDEWRKKPSQYWHNIEYTQTDAFIKKACDWLEKHTFSELNLDFGHFLEIMEFVNRFKEYMKGE